MTSGRWSDRVEYADANHLRNAPPGNQTRDDSLPLQGVAKAGARSRIRRIAGHLTDEDRRVIEVLATVRMASGGQLNRLLWPTTASGARTARRRLHRLSELRVVTRLSRQIGGIKGGSQGYTYALDVAGQRLAQTQHTRTIRRPTPSHDFIDHTLAVTEVYVRLHEAELRGAIEVVRFDGEPVCWREFTGAAGRRERLKPDCYAAWITPEWEMAAFWEIDRGTEHPGRLARKASQYLRYWRNSPELAAGEFFPSVVWLAHLPTRARVITSVMESFDAPAGLFVSLTLDDLENFINHTPRKEVHL